MRSDTAPVPSVLIDARELARMLAVSVPSIWRWKSDGRLPEAISLSSQTIRWRRDIVLEWISLGCPAGSADTTREGQPCDAPPIENQRAVDARMTPTAPHSH